jgi:serine-type D-Ala-D-Ala carboxypeptidase (penicillin-binding protein 5/6)
MLKKKKRKKSKLKLLFVILFIVAIIVPTYNFVTAFSIQSLFEKNHGDITGPIPTLHTVADSSLSITFNELYSRCAILVCLDNHTTLMQKKSESKVYPASLTKMMTAIVAIENLSNLNEQIELSSEMFQDLYNENASMAGFKPGEEVRAIDLLYGAMLPSGAECCVGLANHIAGSENNFIKLMNQKAEDLGLENTHFENTTGIHDDNHYTTVKDLAKLLCYSLQNDTFRKIFTTSRYTSKATNKNPDGITFYSTMFDKINDPSIKGGKIIGGKTGYTEEAGLCLASLAEEGNKEYVLITVGAKGNHKSEQYNIVDAFAVYNRLGED